MIVARKALIGANDRKFIEVMIDDELCVLDKDNRTR